MPAIAHENKILGNINTLNDLTDVDLTSPQNGQVLTIRNGEWVNDDPQGGDTSDLIKWSEASKSVKKNLLKNTATSQIINGVTFTVNDDGSVTANGTATAGAGISLNRNIPFDAGTYVLTADDNGVGGINVSGVYLTMQIGSTNYDVTYLTKKKQTNQPTPFVVSDFRIWINSGVTLNITIYPMLRLASIADATYEPYIPDNTELMRYTDNAVLGAKNLLPNNATSQTVNGVTFTKNADGSISVSGTASANAVLQIIADDSFFENKFETGEKYILTGCPSGGSSSTYFMQTFRMPTVYDYGEGVEFTYGSTGTGKVVQIVVMSGYAISGSLTFKPMIRLATDTDDTYVPYAMTNRELTSLLMPSRIQTPLIHTGGTVIVTCAVPQGAKTAKLIGITALGYPSSITGLSIQADYCGMGVCYFILDATTNNIVKNYPSFGTVDLTY